MTNKIISFTLNLYAFHLRNQLSDTDLADNFDHLWQNIDSLAEKYNIPQLNNFSETLKNNYNSSNPQHSSGSDYLEFSPERYLKFQLSVLNR
jgi:hypothetical protein